MSEISFYYPFLSIPPFLSLLAAKQKKAFQRWHCVFFDICSIHNSLFDMYLMLKDYETVLANINHVCLQPSNNQKGNGSA